MTQPIPIFLRSQSTEPVAPARSGLPLKDLGTTYSMAQEIRWLDETHFAIGRWDGSLTVFAHGEGTNGSPVISAALVAPSLAGVEMISRVMPNLFASSNDGQSIVIWQTDGTFSETGIRILSKLQYDPIIGPANDGAVTECNGVLRLVTGHANGSALLWRMRGDNNFDLERQVDLRSPNPIPSPYGLKNIRGVETWRPGYIVTGSEDGDLCLFDVANGRIVARNRYNVSAQRGINDIAICGDYLTVVNCSVGTNDKNVWLFEITDAGFRFLDAQNLRVDASLPQVFNFCVGQGIVDGTHFFFSATEEGVVWVGNIRGNKLIPLGTQSVSSNFGAALSYLPGRRLLAVAGDNLHLFELM